MGCIRAGTHPELTGKGTGEAVHTAKAQLRHDSGHVPPFSLDAHAAGEWNRRGSAPYIPKTAGTSTTAKTETRPPAPPIRFFFIRMRFDEILHPLHGQNPFIHAAALLTLMQPLYHVSGNRARLFLLCFRLCMPYHPSKHNFFGGHPIDFDGFEGDKRPEKG